MKLLLLLGIATSAAMTATTSLSNPRTGQEEPPQRALLRVGEEVVELSLDGTTGTLADGREVSVTLLPTRQFSLEGSFSFEYPDGWRYSASVGSPTPVDAWWTIGGESVHLYLRRHGGDAAAILEEYVTNSIACGATGRRAVSMELGGRTLDGFAVEQEIGSIRYGPPTHAEMQIFAWQERPGVAWLLQIQRDSPVASAFDIDIGIVLDLSTIPSLLQTESQSGAAVTDVPGTAAPTPTDEFGVVVAATFRWATE